MFLRLYTAAASGSVISGRVPCVPKPTDFAALSVSAFAISVHIWGYRQLFLHANNPPRTIQLLTAGTVKKYSILVPAMKAFP